MESQRLYHRVTSGGLDLGGGGGGGVMESHRLYHRVM